MNKKMVTVSAGKFMLDENPFRFVGVNMYELAYVDESTMQRMLRSAADQGFNAVRFWAFVTMPVSTISDICRIASELNLKLIPVFADMNEFLQGFRVTDEWFRDEYKKTYTSHYETLVGALSDSPEILLWEIFNEPMTSQFGLILDFANNVSEKIKQIDPLHAVSVGTIGGIGDKFGNEFSRFNHSNFKKLYSIESLDAVSMHDYSFGSSFLERADLYFRLNSRRKSSIALSKLDTILNALPDVIDETIIRNFSRTFDFPFSLRSVWRYYNKLNLQIAMSLGKPVYIGEIGVKKKYRDLRKKILEFELKNHFDSGVSGALIWSFETHGRSLDGHDYGFDEKDDFGEIARKFLGDI